MCCTSRLDRESYGFRSKITCRCFDLHQVQLGFRQAFEAHRPIFGHPSDRLPSILGSPVGAEFVHFDFGGACQVVPRIDAGAFRVDESEHGTRQRIAGCGIHFYDVGFRAVVLKLDMLLLGGRFNCEYKVFGRQVPIGGLLFVQCIVARGKRLDSMGLRLGRPSFDQSVERLAVFSLRERV